MKEILSIIHKHCCCLLAAVALEANSGFQETTVVFSVMKTRAALLDAEEWCHRLIHSDIMHYTHTQEQYNICFHIHITIMIFRLHIQIFDADTLIISTHATLNVLLPVVEN